MKIARRTLWGLVGTVAWLVLVAGFVIGLKGWAEFSAMEPNQFGDFFAGVFAPLAFLWLVIGYRQQGEELQLQRDELSLQRQEMKLQREETARLADQAAVQADAIKANELHARKDTFLRFADLMEYDLNQQIARIAEMLGYTNDQWHALKWEQIGNGNRGIFAAFLIANLVRGKHATTLDAIRKWIGGEESLHRYCDRFEKLVDEAREADSEGLLLSYYKFGPHGQLYELLCTALGRNAVRPENSGGSREAQ